MRKSMGPALVFAGVALAALWVVAQAWLERPELFFDVLWSALGFSALLAMVKLPWDLYFDARGLIDDQGAARARGQQVTAAAIEDARGLSRRLLLACVAIHLVSGLAVGLYTLFVPSRLGMMFASLFVLSALFRPMVSAYGYLRERLANLRGELRFPRDDIHALKARVDESELGIRELRRRIEELERGAQRGFEAQQAATEDRAALRKRMDDATARLGAEFERAISQLSEDKELLQGIKAFVRLVKEG